LDDRAVSQLQEPMEVGGQELQDRQGHLLVVRLAWLRRPCGRQVRASHGICHLPDHEDAEAGKAQEEKEVRAATVVETAIQRSVAMRLTIGRKASGAATERDSISRRPCR
jgi:hypothetical protein